MPDEELEQSPFPDYSNEPTKPPLHDLALRLRKLAIKPVKQKGKIKTRMKVKVRQKFKNVRFY